MELLTTIWVRQYLGKAMTSIGIYAGSFDPITNGHLDIISDATKLFDRLIIAIGVNPAKTRLIELERSKELITASIGSLANVEVTSFEGLLAEYCSKVYRENARCIPEFNYDPNLNVSIVRGIRPAGDFEVEWNLAQINKELGHGLQTVWLPAHLSTSHYSSSMVKEAAKYRALTLDMVPKPVLDELVGLYK